MNQFANAYEEAEALRRRSEQWLKDYLATGEIYIRDMPDAVAGPASDSGAEPFSTR